MGLLDSKLCMMILAVSVLIIDINFEARIGTFFDLRLRTSYFKKSSSPLLSHTDSEEDLNYLSKHEDKRPVAIVTGSYESAHTGHMMHIREMFEHTGYKIVTKNELSLDTKWDVMWHHEYSFTQEPFKTLIKNASPNQIVNHVPGSGFYTSKVQLATSDLSNGVPKAFQLPAEKSKLLEYAEKNPDVLWVQKDNTHRNIKIKSTNDMDLSKNNSFVQKFVDNPLLIDNKKFDIGIYTVVTSLLPLRVYIYDGDVLIRFCPEDYHPFDANNVDKYVVGDDYTPIWEINSLKKYFNTQKMSFKSTIDSYLGMQGMDTSKIWLQIRNIIGEVFRTQQTKMLMSLQNLKLNPQYFELSRFDFVVDDQLNVFLMEANMSPNLSSGHFKQNQILYEQVLMNIFSLTGISTPITKEADILFKSRTSEQNPLVNSRDINLPLKFCVENKCESCDEAPECQLCGHCMNTETRKILEQTFVENSNRKQMKRIQFDYENHHPLTKEDHLLTLWLSTKCQLDNTWC
ncbi:putative tubulin polyglutamylase ttll-15 [Caenorhabditis elegans]|uniref:Probable tubulin polyglutamylase ttll-15 n=1 Tax=Caenorhabditis elegans TaxID=6239 RepID=TTL15_CAEEL|nr:putative tubulin polyglutamylase ttll-15 [Caenorhabditis elegans]Q21279.3 RecName: Full=Probable tubulin polyglutamylase ttll-15; AltName: Full=Tubulin--tyrosine ligase-like protein 15 [Caenorhabditis elegans]CAA94900.3 Probable tubulin polyglutamylase ttll-15 [Caenorhabditis elegans]|eukprot:NP_505663.3 Tubulin Tyrosine Ligase Like [Caenorhabditis elegans]